MAEGLFALSIRSRCELSGRWDKNRASEVSETVARDGDRVRKKARDAAGETMSSVREGSGPNGGEQTD